MRDKLEKNFDRRTSKLYFDSQKEAIEFMEKQITGYEEVMRIHKRRVNRMLALTYIWATPGTKVKMASFDVNMYIEKAKTRVLSLDERLLEVKNAYLKQLEMTESEWHQSVGNDTSDQMSAQEIKNQGILLQGGKNVYEEYMYNALCESCYSNSGCTHDCIWEPDGDNQHVYRCTKCGDVLDTGYCSPDVGGYCICGRYMSSDPEPDTYTYYNAQYHKTSSGELEEHYDYNAPTCICGAEPHGVWGSYSCGYYYMTEDEANNCPCIRNDDENLIDCPDCGRYYDSNTYTDCPYCEGNQPACTHENTGYVFTWYDYDQHTAIDTCLDCGAAFGSEEYENHYDPTCNCGASLCDICGKYHTADQDCYHGSGTYSCSCAVCDGNQCGNSVANEGDTCTWCYNNCLTEPEEPEEPEGSTCPRCSSGNYSGSYCEDCGGDIFGFSCPEHPSEDSTHYLVGDSGTFTCDFGCICIVEAGDIRVNICPKCNHSLAFGEHEVKDCGFCSDEYVCGYWEDNNFYCYNCEQWTAYGS